MIPLNNTENKCKVVGNNSKPQTLKISANAFSFNMLINQLYANKAESMVREIIANAVDATIEAGNEELPVVVSYKDNVFTVRDFGVGMTHDFVVSNYSTLFESTKRNTNSQTGMIGLGSKSPFAVARSFTLTCFDATKKRVYSIFLDDENIPHFTLAAEVDGDFVRGVEVAVILPDNFKYEMENAINIARVTHYDRPVVFETHIGKDIKVIKIADGIAIIKSSVPLRSSSYSRKFGFIRQGSGIYSLHALNIWTYTYPCPSNIDYDLIIDVPIGSYSVSTSRESLSLDEDEKNHLRKNITDEYKRARNVFVDAISSCNTYDEAIATVKNDYGFDTKDAWDVIQWALGRAVPVKRRISAIIDDNPLSERLETHVINDKKLVKMYKKCIKFAVKQVGAARFKPDHVFAPGQMIFVLPFRLRRYVARVEMFLQKHHTRNPGDFSINSKTIIFTDRKNVENLIDLIPFENGKYITIVREKDLPSYSSVVASNFTPKNRVKTTYKYYTALGDDSIYTNDAPSKEDFYICSTIGGLIFSDVNEHLELISAVTLRSIIKRAISNGFLKSNVRVFVVGLKAYNSNPKRSVGDAVCLYSHIKKELSDKFKPLKKFGIPDIRKLASLTNRVGIPTKNFRKIVENKCRDLGLLYDISDFNNTFPALAALYSAFRFYYPELFTNNTEKENACLEALEDARLFIRNNAPFALFGGDLSHRGVTDEYWEKYIDDTKIPENLSVKLNDVNKLIITCKKL
jgi:transposase-like protein